MPIQELFIKFQDSHSIQSQPRSHFKNNPSTHHQFHLICNIGLSKQGSTYQALRLFRIMDFRKANARYQRRRTLKRQPASLTYARATNQALIANGKMHEADELFSLNTVIETIQTQVLSDRILQSLLNLIDEEFINQETQARLISTLSVFGSISSIRFELYQLIGTELIQILNEPNDPSLIILSLDGIFDLYGDEEKPYDSEVFRKLNYCKRLIECFIGYERARDCHLPPV
ncbi:hypothetical protein DFH28DRAFT_1178976 [Melampsora americana]|nr:hypothetical protein DFH28DRAFT_1178976 [Melampsora americana]